MRPQRIILIRHGESMANVDRTLHANTPDHKIPLTAMGRQQALAAGSAIYDELSRVEGAQTRIQVYTSPYCRTRQTFDGILQGLRTREPNLSHYNYEDPRLREQEFGNYRPPGSYTDIEHERDSFGTFFYRVPGGESGADVFDRLSGALDTIHRDFQKSDFPQNMLVVSHGLTVRLFLMRWFHWTVEEFEMLRNPRNCQFYVLDKMESGKYQLITEMTKYTEAETRDYLSRKKGAPVDMTYADQNRPAAEPS